jgi:hypothetical protein
LTGPGEAVIGEVLVGDRRQPLGEHVRPPLQVTVLLVDLVPFEVGLEPSDLRRGPLALGFELRPVATEAHQHVLRSVVLELSDRLLLSREALHRRGDLLVEPEQPRRGDPPGPDGPLDETERVQEVPVAVTNEGG